MRSMNALDTTRSDRQRSAVEYQAGRLERTKWRDRVITGLGAVAAVGSQLFTSGDVEVVMCAFGATAALVTPSYRFARRSELNIQRQELERDIRHEHIAQYLPQIVLGKSLDLRRQEIWLAHQTNELAFAKANPGDDTRVYREREDVLRTILIKFRAHSNPTIIELNLAKQGLKYHLACSDDEDGFFNRRYREYVAAMDEFLPISSNDQVTNPRYGWADYFDKCAAGEFSEQIPELYTNVFV